MNLTKIKQLKNWIPETYLVLSVLVYYVMDGIFINPIPLFLISVLAIFLWLKSKLLGVLISAVFLLLNLYMVLAMFSELSEFTTFNKGAWSLLFGGGIYLGLNIFLSIMMLMKWVSKNEESIQTTV